MDPMDSSCSEPPPSPPGCEGPPIPATLPPAGRLAAACCTLPLPVDLPSCRAARAQVLAAAPVNLSRACTDGMDCRPHGLAGPVDPGRPGDRSGHRQPGVHRHPRRQAAAGAARPRAADRPEPGDADAPGPAGQHRLAGDPHRAAVRGVRACLLRPRPDHAVRRRVPAVQGHHGAARAPGGAHATRSLAAGPTRGSGRWWRRSSCWTRCSPSTR